jgi:hypothetical protein
MTRTAKESFINSPWKESHSKIVQTEDFLRSCDYALLQLMEEQPDAMDPAKGWDSHSQLTGAKRVLDILKTLSTPEKKPEAMKQPAPYR